MVRLQNCVFGGVLVLTLTVLLNTPPAEAANCADDNACSNGGTCPDTSAPCDCSASDYIGDTCTDEVCAGDGDCDNGGTCDLTATPKVCQCAVGYLGKTCADACDGNDGCQNGGTCNSGTCSCDTGYKGDFCQNECESSGDCGTGGTCEAGPPKTCTCTDKDKEGPGCTKDKSGASTVTGFSLMALCVVLVGYLL